MTPFTTLEFGTAQELWMGINEHIATCRDKNIIVKGSQMYALNMVLQARRLYIDPELDLYRYIGYSPQKWNSLVDNYINMNYVDILKSQVQAYEAKKSKQYTESLSFDNSHKSGKGCLLALTCERRPDSPNPIITFMPRVSEVTKRFIFDLLLVKRVADYVYGPDITVSLQVVCTQMYITAEDFVIYTLTKSLKKMFKNTDIDLKTDQTYLKLKKQYDKMTQTDPETIKYRVHKRVAEHVQNFKNKCLDPKKIDGEIMRVKNLHFREDKSIVDGNLHDPKKIRKFKRENR